VSLASHFRSRPFEHLLIAPVLNAPLEAGLISELQDAEWESRGDTFYRFDVPRLDLTKARIRAMLDTVCSDIKPTLEIALTSRLAPAAHLEIHRYRTGDGIGPHTDAATAEVRCVININTGWSLADGGVWTLAADSALKVGTSQLPSTSNSAFAFSTGSTSFHALSLRYAGIGYGLTIRFPRQ